MDFGITFPSYIRAYHDAKLAEDYGFSHAWFYDSHSYYGFSSRYFVFESLPSKGGT